MPDHQPDWERGLDMGGSPPPSRLLGRLPRPLRDPFAIFLLVAALLFGIYWLTAGRAEEIDVSSSVQRSLADDYLMMTGHPPDAKAKARLLRDYMTDEILFREAVHRGMHITDKATRQRLIDRVRFMISGAPADPTEEQLIDYYSGHGAAYRSEPQITLEHVFFAQPPADPAAILARLRGGASIKGDDFWMGRMLPDYGISMLRGMFGQPFLQRLQIAPENQWFGPLTSSRGTHFVRVGARTAAALMPYPLVRDQVRQDYLSTQSAVLVDGEVKRLEKQYDIRVAR